MGRALTNPEDYKQKVLWAVLTTAISGLFRLGELTGKSTSEGLRTKDVRWVGSNRVDITLVVSKTQIFREAATVSLFRNESDICPVKALDFLRGAIRPPNSHFFELRQGIPLRKATVIGAIRQLLQRANTREALGLDVSRFAGHSLRRGGATSLAIRGVPDHLIQALGRWKSDCYKLYIDTPISDKEKAMRILAGDSEEVRRKEFGVGSDASDVGKGAGEALRKGQRDLQIPQIPIKYGNTSSQARVGTSFNKRRVKPGLHRVKATPKPGPVHTIRQPKNVAPKS